MKRWFLPESVDCLGLLTHQGDLVVAGIQAFAQWSHGEAGKAVEVVEGDRRADEARKDVLVAIKRSFVTPVSPEDIFELSERLDAIANATKDVVPRGQARRHGTRSGHGRHGRSNPVGGAGSGPGLS